MSNIATTKSTCDVARALETYQREPSVQAVLESWRHLPIRLLMHKLRDVSDEPPVPLEALVAVARALVRIDAGAEAWSVVEILAERTAAKTYRHLVTWGVTDVHQREDVTRDILHMMTARVLSTTPGDEFWECRFWVCFDRRVRTLLRDYCRNQPDYLPWDEITENSTQSSNVASDAVADAVPAELLTDSIVARAGLERLPEPLRTAFYLKHYAGYKEESREDEPTIASTLAASGRTVRNYLRRAEELLVVWRSEEIHDD